MRLSALALLACAAPALAQLPQQQIEIQRALIQRDQQSADFARGATGSGRAAGDAMNARQLRDAGVPLSPDPAVARELLPYQRESMARERESSAGKIETEKPKAKAGYPPLPRPGSGGPPQVVEPLIGPIQGPSVGG